MIDFNNTTLQTLVLHRVGNRTNDEGIQLASSGLLVTDELKELLGHYFMVSFRSNEYFNFDHETNLDLNEGYVYASKIFDDPKVLYEQSVNLAKHLYEQSTHPKIKGGEFYTVYFKDCIVEGTNCDAVGLFKSENKETFLKVQQANDGFELKSQRGVNINKLDKGCLIFNTEKDQGYVVAVVDSVSRGSEAQYWVDDFLHLRPRKDEYHQTQNLLTLCKNFIVNELPQQFEVSKADQVDYLNKSVDFFKKQDKFEITDFARQVINQPEVIDSFNRFKDQYQRDQALDIPDRFNISESAVKKQSRVFRSVIKLDKNFHIYVHANRQLIEQGVDEQGRKYYKIYYDQES
ncbi:nucleoid-associated protein [Mangrovibacterium lignilyticum]|uniref:nucleoid-associated protein n=1 Tax=Mangrovibacterium lignilyticum TaxID=2668052 RepID=UPI0013D261C9|nr:nucleoid-associated protein [Mangrovibacterium lignilyticum]